MVPILINDTPVDCINQAAIVYHVPATIIVSVIRQENGRKGDAIKNKNGTIDYGVMQINSVWLPTIAAYGYTKEDLQFDPCKNIMVGAWIIGRHIANGNNIWQGIANYHSKTKAYNRPYQKSVRQNYRQLLSAIQVV